MTAAVMLESVRPTRPGMPAATVDATVPVPDLEESRAALGVNDESRWSPWLLGRAAPSGRPAVQGVSPFGEEARVGGAPRMILVSERSPAKASPGSSTSFYISFSRARSRELKRR